MFSFSSSYIMINVVGASYSRLLVFLAVVCIMWSFVNADDQSANVVDRSDDKRGFRLDLGKREADDSVNVRDQLRRSLALLAERAHSIAQRSRASFRGDLGKRRSSFRGDLGKRFGGDEDDRYDRGFDVEPEMNKRPRTASFRGDLGKRIFRGDLGKRGQLESMDALYYPVNESEGLAMTEKRRLRADLGKRRSSFRGDLGKRRSSFRGDLGK